MKKDFMGLVIYAIPAATLARLAATSQTGEGLVPPAGLEPALPKEPHFECGASTNSAKGAYPIDEGVSPMGAADVDWQMGGPRSIPVEGATKVTHARTTAVIRGRFPDHIEEVLTDIQLPNGWGIEARSLALATFQQAMDDREYQVRITCGPTVDNMWWRLSRHMTKGEVVQTVFKATLTAMEHEVRETFLYKGVSVLDPHYDIDQLVEFRKSPTSILGRS